MHRGKPSIALSVLVTIVDGATLHARPCRLGPERVGGHTVCWDTTDIAAPLHLPANHHSVSGEFVDQAHAAIDDILSRGRVPVVVGGTMMYLQWLVHGKPDAPKKVKPH